MFLAKCYHIILTFLRVTLRPKNRTIVFRILCSLVSVFVVTLLLHSKSDFLRKQSIFRLKEKRETQNSHQPQWSSSYYRLHKTVDHDNPPTISPFYQEQFHKLNPYNESWGANGNGVFLSDADDIAQSKKLFSSGAFDVFISDRLPPNRSLPDVRPTECASVSYALAGLPTSSVIIIFTDEIWSALIRTIWSVFNRSPPQLLHEVILVDDFSQHSYLKTPLDVYCKAHFGSKVKIVRSSKRVGLIKARLSGAKVATGDILIFLDSHCEATVGWLEPLAFNIKQDRTAVIAPVIDVISDKSLEYSSGDSYYFQVGGFTWSGHFTWIDVREDFTRKYPTSPLKSPTMAGGLFAIDRDYFYESGSYDEKMEIWGGENLEMSFRIWMCGGKLLIHPCSHVGHIFRDFHPYSFGGKDTHGVNTLRTVLVWMDPEYQKYFFRFRSDLNATKPGDLRERFKLKEKLKCKSFRWYLDNVFKGRKFIFDKDVIGYGLISNPVTDLCLDILNRDEETSNPLGLYTCSFDGIQTVTNQALSFTLAGEIRREETCAQDADSYVSMTKCIEPDLASDERLRSVRKSKLKQTWSYDRSTQQIKNSFSHKCLTTRGQSSGDDVLVHSCNEHDLHQKWVIQSQKL